MNTLNVTKEELLSDVLVREFEFPAGKLGDTCNFAMGDCWSADLTDPRHIIGAICTLSLDDVLRLTVLLSLRLNAKTAVCDNVEHAATIRELVTRTAMTIINKDMPRLQKLHHALRLSHDLFDDQSKPNAVHLMELVIEHAEDPKKRVRDLVCMLSCLRDFDLMLYAGLTIRKNCKPSFECETQGFAE